MSIATTFVIGAAAGIGIWAARPGGDLRAEGIPVQAQSQVHTSDGETAAAATFTQFPVNARFETADTWVHDGKRYRLYGLQSCLRGTQVTLRAGVKRDCGDLNILMAQAVIRDTRPVCSTIRALDQSNALVVCQTTAGNHRYDLATYLIAQGWGFAAMSGKGAPVVPNYRVAEEAARKASVGLWAYPDMPHPLTVLGRAGSSQ